MIILRHCNANKREREREKKKILVMHLFMLDFPSVYFSIAKKIKIPVNPRVYEKERETGVFPFQ